MLNSLNSKQKEAVLHDQGPLLILAGAGSGKTRALTHRLAYLVKERRISPLNILCLTFTNKAADEMISRVTRLLAQNQKSETRNQNQIRNQNRLSTPSDFKNSSLIRHSDLGFRHFPYMGTFHSVCAKILRREIINLNQGFTPGFTIFDEEDSTRLIKNILKALNIDPKKFAPEAIKVYISRAKNELISPLKYKNLTDSIFTQTVARVYPLYEKKLKELNALDFDNLINKLIELFKKESEILEKYQRLFEYILVDEYQDTNHSQYLFLKLLAQKHQNISVVGDDWQSIYRFRGADFRNILDFKKDYPAAKIIKLEENYRSTDHILNAAQSVIKNNSLRSDKNLFSSMGEGEKVKLVETINHEDEGQFIIKEIQKLAVEDGSKLNQSVILYRTNAQSRALEEVMLRFGIPYRIIGGVRFYQRKEIKDILAYLQILKNPQELISLNRIINLPPRGISKNTISLLKNDGLKSIAQGGTPQSSGHQALRPSIQQKIQDFISLIRKIKKASQEKNVIDLIPFVLKTTGYKDYILDGSEEGLARFENIKELLSVAGKYSSLKPQESLLNFLEEVALLSDLDSLDEKTDALTLMTMHNAKGLEFDNVFIAGAEEDLIPHSRSQTDEQELEEERRLFYVAMTRARKRLYLIYTNERLLWGRVDARVPSRFLDEINLLHIEKLDDLEEIATDNIEDESQIQKINLEVGDMIEHAQFGRGEVVGFDDEEAIIDFDKFGKKRLSTQYAPLKKIRNSNLEIRNNI